MREKRPFLEDGSQYGISRTAFRRMRKAEKRELMLQWFHENFEDPAVSTPYESAEGGYQWIWGGPYEARDELSSKFDSVATETLIEEVVQEVERGGLTEWAPVHIEEVVEDWEDIDWSDELEKLSSLDSFSDERSERYGTPADHEARDKVRAALQRLSDVLNTPRVIGIGHNRPPAEIDEPEEIKNVRAAIPKLQLEFGKANPVISFVKQWARPLRNALFACGKWTGGKLDKGVDAGVKVIGAGGATWILSHCIPSLHTALNSIIDWLEIVAKTIK